LKPPQSPSIHMDWGRTEQTLKKLMKEDTGRG
jgi:predicted transcriptional regulator